MFGYNMNVAVLSSVSSAGLHVLAHMRFASWTLQEGIGNEVTWVMAVGAFVAVYALLTEKDNYHN